MSLLDHGSFLDQDGGGILDQDVIHYNTCRGHLYIFRSPYFLYFMGGGRLQKDTIERESLAFKTTVNFNVFGRPRPTLAWAVQGEGNELRKPDFLCFRHGAQQVLLKLNTLFRSVYALSIAPFRGLGKD